MAEVVRQRSPFVVAAVAWLVPGAGYLLIGQRARGLTVGITILALIVLGILIGGVRVYDVPGYDRYGDALKVGLRRNERKNLVPVHDTDAHPSPEYRGNERQPRNLNLAITSEFTAQLFDKPWYALQILSGAPAVVFSKVSINVSHPGNDPKNGADVEDVRRSHAAVWEMGVLYTAIAGMLNLLAMIDSAYRGSHPPAEPESQPAPEKGKSIVVPPPPASSVQRGSGV